MRVSKWWKNFNLWVNYTFIFHSIGLLLNHHIMRSSVFSPLELLPVSVSTFSPLIPSCPLLPRKQWKRAFWDSAKYKMKGLKMVQAKTCGLLKPGKLVRTLTFRLPLTPKIHLPPPPHPNLINHLFNVKCSLDVVLYLEYTESFESHTLGPCHWQTLVVRLYVWERAAVWMRAHWLRAFWSSSSLTIVLKHRNSTALQGCSHTSPPPLSLSLSLPFLSLCRLIDFPLYSHLTSLLNLCRNRRTWGFSL